MLLGLITIPPSPWLWAAAVVLAATLVLLLWSYRRAPQLGTAQKIAFCLKLAGVLVLVLCLIEPLATGSRARSGANLFVVLADNSAGMNVRDQGDAQSRGEILHAVLQAGRTGWLAALSEDFQVRQYLFDSRLRGTADFSDLVFDGKATAIGTALRTVAERYRDRPLAGILLMTDGNATDRGEQFYDLSGVPPVYPVLIGRTRPPKDIAMTNVSVSQTAFEDAPVTIQADVEAAGYAGLTVKVDLTDESGGLLERRLWSVAKSEQKEAFRFRLRPDKTGVLFYHVRVAEVPAEGSADQSAAQAEATSANNHRIVVVDRPAGPYRILYVAGRPNWEYKFLHRAISDDRQLQLVGLIRVARREPKYDWRGRTGETSNPLYRGFDAQDQERTEQYDQPVLVRLNTRDQLELRDGFPKTAQDLFGYHAVVLDDVEAEFFSHDQMDLLRRFVVERGGGLLMLGGKQSFQQGRFDRTPVGDILPVYLDRLPAGDPPAQVRLNLTRQGWLQPWARLRDNQQQEQQRLSMMPDFRVVNRVGRARPGARIIADIADSQTEHCPALVIQRLGNGRTAALTIGDVWRWGLQQRDLHEDMDKFWRQTLRWLVADVPGRVSLEAMHKPDEPSRAIVLRLRARDEKFEPMNNVSVAIDLRLPAGEQVQLTAEPVLSDSGLYEAIYVPRKSGGYVAQATVTDANGTEIGGARLGWATDLDAQEFRSVKTDPPLLAEIAAHTAGRVVELDQLAGFARSLPRRRVPITDVWVRPLWDLPGVLPAIFLCIVACLVAEWAIRRWKGMP